MLYLVFPTPSCRSCHETMKNTTPSSWISALKKSLSRSKRSCLSDSTSQQPHSKEQGTATCTKSSTCLCLVRPTRDNEKNSSKPNIDAISKEENDGLLMQTTRKSMAAIRIQTTFRMYLARKALRSLKALVRLQALVRGCYVRRRTELTLKCLASLLRIQERSRTQRLMSLNGFRSSDHDHVKAKEFLASSPSSTAADSDSESEADIHENQGLCIDEILATYTGQRQTESEDYVLDEKVAAKRIQITRVNTKIAHRNNRSISAPRTPKKLSKCRSTLTNSHVHYQNAKFSTPMPRTPNYMASTESARAKMNRNRNEGTSSVPVPSVCSTSNSPRQVKLFMKSTLPPVRTSRSNTVNSTGKCHEGGMSIMSPGESRKLVRKLMLQERQSSKYVAGIHQAQID